MVLIQKKKKKLTTHACFTFFPSFASLYILKYYGFLYE
ncbi:unnamed protein product [Brassica rapa subsp. narinosa]